MWALDVSYTLSVAQGQEIASHAENMLLGRRGKKRKGESAAGILPASYHAKMINCSPAGAVSDNTQGVECIHLMQCIISLSKL